MGHPQLCTPTLRSFYFALWRRMLGNGTIIYMLKSLTTAVLLAAGTMLVANGSAQQTPAATTPTAPATTTPKAPAKKPATATKSAVAAPALKTRKEKFSYALGMNIGNGLGTNLKKQSVEVDANLVAEGLKDSMGNGKTRLTEDEAKAVLTEVQNEVRQQQQGKVKEAADKNKTEGETFLAANKSKDGVVTLPSGLQYKIMTEGTGAKPTAADTVVCNYRGTLLDGTEFDSSYKRGQPATFPVSGVIKGWTEALQLMPTGSKWQLFIPANLAYGDKGAGGEIGPGATLIFEVELISIQDKGKGKDQEKKEQDKKEDENKPDDKK
jgi:FKBP-type peptidyl-prolyl cis-trans isomerase FklB